MNGTAGLPIRRGLIGFRALQAVGGSMLNPVAMSIIVSVYTDRRDRARAVGVWGSTIGITLAAGPVLGGVLVNALDWRSVFWVNVPVGVAAILLTRFFVPESRAERARAFDPAGQLLIVALFASIIFATIEGPRHGWGSPLIAGRYALAVLAGAGLTAAESRRPEPVIDLRCPSIRPGSPVRSPPAPASSASPSASRSPARLWPAPAPASSPRATPPGPFSADAASWRCCSASSAPAAGAGCRRPRRRTSRHPARRPTASRPAGSLTRLARRSIPAVSEGIVSCSDSSGRDDPRGSAALIGDAVTWLAFCDGQS